MTRRARLVLKALVWADHLAPLAALLYRLAADPLLTNPIAWCRPPWRSG